MKQRVIAGSTIIQYHFFKVLQTSSDLEKKYYKLQSQKGLTLNPDPSL